MIMKQRAIIFRESIYGSLFNGIRERFGESGANAFLYMIGLDAGREAAHSLSDFLTGKSMAEALEMLVLIGRALGYAELDELKIMGEEILLRIKSNWESACLKKRYKTRNVTGPRDF